MSAVRDSIDEVSICVFCREDATVLLSTQSDGDLAKFPSLSIINTSWRLTVRKLISKVSGLSGKEIAIMRITKFWVPDLPQVFHVIYKVKCTLSEKKNLKLQEGSVVGLKWFSVDQVQQMSLTGQLVSPELQEYVAQSLQPRNFYPLTADPEASKEGFDILNEVLEKNLIIDTDNSFLTQSENLIKLAHFTKQDQKNLYKEFWLRTFPYLFMNSVKFFKFMAELGWKKEEWPGLFECADVSSRGGLTFKDALIFLAVTEPDTPHGSGSGDIRCQYIFRYFDKNKDNILDHNELRALIIAINSTKGGPPKTAILEKLVENSIQDLGLGTKRKISMNTFVKKVGELKFRGTSTIFRSSISVLKYLSTSSPQQKQVVDPQKKSVLPSMPAWRGISAFTVPSRSDIDLIKAATRNKVFEVATHAVCLSRTGLLEDVRPLDTVPYGKSMSLADRDYFRRPASLQYYDIKAPANELLGDLEYFASEFSSRAKQDANKPAFNWGTYNMLHVKDVLMTVCDICIKIMEKESRLLRVSSPLYVLDLHGNYPDLIVFEHVLWSFGIALTPCSLLFLGDYVDRGAFGIEVIAYLFAQKVKNPTKVFLLRGNHEMRSIQKSFTFYLECQRKFGDEYFYDIWNKINQVFDVMSFAAVIDHKLFCCHGGIPPPWLCSRIDVIDSIPCPLSTPEESLLAWELMWNDPVKTGQVPPSVALEMEANEGFAVNTLRKTGRIFSTEALETFLKKNDLSHVIRAHEVKQAGFQVQQGGKLLTVFSSSGYCGGPNEAACVFVSQEKIRILRINTN